MPGILQIFYSYQVLNAQNASHVLSFGHGCLTVDVETRSFNFPSCVKSLKNEISTGRVAQGFGPIDWDNWKLHLLAFNQIPG